MGVKTVVLVSEVIEVFPIRYFLQECDAVSTKLFSDFTDSGFDLFSCSFTGVPNGYVLLFVLFVLCVNY